MVPTVVSLENAIKLKDAGYPQGESGWRYERHDEEEDWLLGYGESPDGWLSIDAPTVDELAEIYVGNN